MNFQCLNGPVKCAPFYDYYVEVCKILIQMFTSSFLKSALVAPRRKSPRISGDKLPKCD